MPFAADKVYPESACPKDSDKEYIRVAILRDINSFSLQISGSYRVINGVDSAILAKGRGLITTAACCGKHISLAGINYSTNKLIIEIDPPGVVSVNKREFRDNIMIIGRPGSSLSVVNCILLENYIKGILYHEVSHYWPQEALKAQAVACRTDAVYQMAENSRRD